MPCAKPAATPAGPANSAPLRRTREMRISELREKAERGNAVAQTVLGVCYLEGIDVEVDDKKALRLFLLSAAADQGVPRAKTNLARMYAEGLGTRTCRRLSGSMKGLLRQVSLLLKLNWPAFMNAVCTSQQTLKRLESGMRLRRHRKPAWATVRSWKRRWLTSRDRSEHTHRRAV